MGDSNYYPDRWKEYLSALRMSGSSPSREWGIFAARYRAAGNFHSINFFKTSSRVAEGYTKAFQLLLSYSAFESACAASGAPPTERPISSSAGIAKNARLELIKAFRKTPESKFPLREALASRRLEAKVDAFFAGQDENLQPIASAIRHLFAHGIWTPHGSKCLTVTARNALDLTAQAILAEGDRILEEELFSRFDRRCSQC